jgi:hypothetical protein
MDTFVRPGVIMKRSFQPIAFAIAASTLSAASFALPSMRIDRSGLGTSEIADIVAANWQVNPERFIPTEIEKALGGDSSTAPTASTLQKMGFSCAGEIASCHYSGFLTYTLSGLPKENQQFANARVDITIGVIEGRPLRFKASVKTSR